MVRWKLILPAFVFQLVLAAGAGADVFPPGITSYTEDSYYVRIVPALLDADYSGPTPNRHITVDPTDVAGEYNIYLVFSKAAKNGNVCEAYFASKPSNLHGPDSFDVQNMNDISIPWPMTGPDYATRCPALASDDEGNVYVTVRRVEKTTPPDSYTALATKTAEGTWDAIKMYGPVPCGDWTQTVTGQGTIASSRSGDWLAFSSQYNRYPVPFYAGEVGWYSRIWGCVNDNAGSPGEEWDKVMLGGYDHTATGYWNSVCAVDETGTGLIVGYVCAFDRFPLAGYDAGRGLNFGVGTDERNTWEFARSPFEDPDNCWGINQFSLAPYTENYAGSNFAHFVWVAYSGEPRYASYTFGVNPIKYGWSSPLQLGTGIPGAGYYDFPQCTVYVVDGDPPKRYLIAVFEVYVAGADKRVYLGMWDLDDNCAPVFDAFQVAPDELWYEDPYEQKFANVCVEKAGGEGEFDIHVCWTNCVWFGGDPPYPHPGEVHYRAFHCAPPQ